jgi:hypothetical protein
MTEAANVPHDIERVSRDLYEGVGHDKHPVGLFLGAGCPMAIRVGDAREALIPDVRGLTQRICKELEADEKFVQLMKQLADDGDGQPTIEVLLSRVRNLRTVAGAGNARGLTSTDLDELDRILCHAVCAVVKVALPTRDTPYHKLARWMGAARRANPIQIFTTNYDLLMEQALEEAEVPYFDGFVGTRRPFFDLTAMEDDALPPRWARLWKLHGSINWCMDGGRVCRRMDLRHEGEDLLIHPSDRKYDQSRRMPYLAMIDRLRAFLRLPSAVLVTCGYSLSDDHLNEVIIQGLRSNPTAVTFALLFGTLDEEARARALIGRVPTNLGMLARDRAVLRRREAQWRASDPAAAFVLGDFAELAALLEQQSGVHVRDDDA